MVFESSGAVSPDPQVSTIPSCDRFNCGRARSQMASKLPRPFTSNCDRPTDRVSLMSAIGRFCCKSNLETVVESDSVTVTRTFARYGDDGSAQPRSGAVVLSLQS